jgi:hypothetical protein
MSDVVTCRYRSGSAEVTINGRLVPVSRRDEAARDHTCPIEMVAASLGA